MTVPQFPVVASQLAFPRKRSPRVSTLRQKAISGRETFQPLWAAPVYDIVIDVAALDASGLARGGVTASGYQTIVGFWNSVMTTAGGVFAYVDPEDNAVTSQEMGLGDGATTSFQLVRTLGGFDDPVLDPVSGPAAATVTWDYGDAASPVVPAGAPADCGNCTVAPTTWFDLGFAATLQIFLGAYATHPTTPLAPFAFANGTADASGGVVTITPAPGDGVQLTWTGSFRWLCRFADDTLALSEFMFQLHEMKQVKFSTVKL